MSNDNDDYDEEADVIIIIKIDDFYTYLEDFSIEEYLHFTYIVLFFFVRKENV